MVLSSVCDNLGSQQQCLEAASRLLLLNLSAFRLGGASLFRLGGGMWGTVSRKLKSERCHLGLDQCFIRPGLGVTCSTTRRHLHRSEVCPKSPFPWAWVVTLSSVLYTRGIASTDVFVRVLQTGWGRCVGEARRCDQGAGAGGRWSQCLRQGQRGQTERAGGSGGSAPSWAWGRSEDRG